MNCGTTSSNLVYVQLMFPKQVGGGAGKNDGRKSPKFDDNYKPTDPRSSTDLKQMTKTSVRHIKIKLLKTKDK